MVFGSFKRFVYGVYKAFSPDEKPEDSVSRTSRSTLNGSVGHVNEDPYSFSEDDSVPQKKQKLNGFFGGDQKHGPLSRAAKGPASRAPLFASHAMSDRSSQSVRKQPVNHNGHVPESTSNSWARFISRGRSDSTKLLDAPVSDPVGKTDFNRRFMQNNIPSGSSNCRNLPLNHTFSTTANVPHAGDRDVQIIGERNFTNNEISSRNASSVSPTTRSKTLANQQLTPFSEYLSKNQKTAVEGYQTTATRRNNSPRAPPITSNLPRPGTSITHQAFVNSYRKAGSRLPDSVTVMPLESSYSSRMRQGLRRHTLHSMVEPSRNHQQTPDIITIDDSDEENATGSVSPKSTGYRNTPSHFSQIRTRNDTRRLEQHFSVRKLTENGNDFATQQAQIYEDIYRNHAIPKERQDDIRQRLNDRVKEIDAQAQNVDFIPLNSEQEDDVTEALSPGRPEEVLSDAFKITIRRKDMVTLKGLNWLNDEVANFFLEMIVDRSVRNPQLPKVYTFNTFFYPQLINKGFQSLKRWTRRVDIFSYNMILVPVHLSSHWCLAVINLKDKTMKYYDSLGHQNTQCFQLLQGYLEEESLDKKRTDVRLDWEEWNFIFAADEGIPQQKNMCDCGVFMLKFADFVSRNKPADFSQVDMPYFRRRICWEILQKKLVGS